MAADLPLALWPISVVLLAACGWATWRLRQLNAFRSKPVVTAFVASIVVFVVLPVYATTFWATWPGSSPATQELPTTVLGVFWWAYVLLLIGLVALARQRRLVLAAFIAPMLWFNFAVFFVCAMAVSGLWV